MQTSAFALKVSSKCNLNCSYCYVYNKGDSSWKQRSSIMSEEVFYATINRIYRHCISTNLQKVLLTFHGGEPTLIGVKRFDDWCNKARHLLKDIEVTISIQTNGTLFNEDWAKVFLKHSVRVGISMDGPESIHNAFRIDHKGKGSYSALEQGLSTLREWSVPFGILCVIQLGENPLIIHRHLMSSGCKSIGYLFPYYTYDTIEPVRKLYGETPVADFLIPIFDEWLINGYENVRIREFWNIGRLIMGGASRLDALGNNAYSFLFVETDGDIEGLDILRTCDDELYRTGLNVFNDDFKDVIKDNELHSRLLAGTVSIPEGCHSCPEKNTCAGGYFPHRYSKERKFDNPSIWCADLLKLFGYIRQRINVSVEETSQLKQLQQSAVSIIQ